MKEEYMNEQKTPPETVMLYPSVYAYKINEYHVLKTFLESNATSDVVMFVTASWCSICNNIYSFVCENFQKKHTINIIVDYDFAKTIVHKYKIQVIPTLIHFSNAEVNQICMSGSHQKIQGFFDNISV